jgi:hypothetical protein
MHVSGTAHRIAWRNPGNLCGGSNVPRKNNSLDLTQPLIPHFFYRRHGPIAKGVIGLEDSQIDVRIKSGELPLPVKAF